MSKKNWIPATGGWNFKSPEIAKRFDNHVREQLPWYDMVTGAVQHIAQHYIPKNGKVYDIGASTGNVGRALEGLLKERKASLTAIEESKAMLSLYNGPGELVNADAVDYEFLPYDFAVCFLVLMFIPIPLRADFIMKLRGKIKPGGALVVVDKIVTPTGYAGTCMRRMAMRWKLDAGTSHREVLNKELSLSGYQRPLDPRLFANDTQWFQLGEFAGWIIDKAE